MQHTPDERLMTFVPKCGKLHLEHLSKISNTINSDEKKWTVSRLWGANTCKRKTGLGDFK